MEDPDRNSGSGSVWLDEGMAGGNPGLPAGDYID